MYIFVKIVFYLKFIILFKKNTVSNKSMQLVKLLSGKFYSKKKYINISLNYFKFK